MSATKVDPPGIFPAPPGVTPNYVNPPQHTNGLVPLIVIFLSLATFVLLLRLYTKAFIVRLLGWEDVVITIAWMCDASMMGLYLAGLHVKSATHMWNFTIYNFPKYAKVATLSTPTDVYDHGNDIANYLEARTCHGTHLRACSRTPQGRHPTILPAP